MYVCAPPESSYVSVNVIFVEAVTTRKYAFNSYIPLRGGVHVKIVCAVVCVTSTFRTLIIAGTRNVPVVLDDGGCVFVKDESGVVSVQVDCFDVIVAAIWNVDPPTDVR